MGNFCALCSTRAVDFFENGKVKISQESCVKVVAACVHTWRFMFNTIQTIKTLVQVPKIQKFESQTGTAVQPISTTTGVDTSAEVNSINTSLDAVALLDTANLVFNDNVENLCVKLLTFDKPNEEIEAPRPERMEEAINEQKKEDDRIKALPTAEKALWDQKLQEMKTEMATKRTQDLAQAATRIASLDQAITAAKTEIETQKAAINTLKTQIEAKRTELADTTLTDQQKIAKKVELDTMMGNLKEKTMAVQTANDAVQNQLQLVLEKCIGTACPEVGTKIQEFNVKFANEKAVVIDELRRQEKIMFEEMMLKVRMIREFILGKFA